MSKRLMVILDRSLFDWFGVRTSLPICLLGAFAGPRFAHVPDTIYNRHAALEQRPTRITHERESRTTCEPK